MDCGLSSTKIIQKRIIGGREARFAEFPWQAHVRISEFQCGGVLGTYLLHKAHSCPASSGWYSLHRILWAHYIKPAACLAYGLTACRWRMCYCLTTRYCMLVLLPMYKTKQSPHRPRTVTTPTPHRPRTVPAPSRTVTATSLHCPRTIREWSMY